MLLIIIVRRKSIYIYNLSWFILKTIKTGLRILELLIKNNLFRDSYSYKHENNWNNYEA